MEPARTAFAGSAPSSADSIGTEGEIFLFFRAKSLSGILNDARTVVDLVPANSNGLKVLYAGDRIFPDHGTNEHSFTIFF